jgi:hypothetical protein
MTQNPQKIQRNLLSDRLKSLPQHLSFRITASEVQNACVFQSAWEPIVTIQFPQETAAFCADTIARKKKGWVRLGYVRRLRLLAQDQQPAEDGGKSRTNWLILIHDD